MADEKKKSEKKKMTFEYAGVKLLSLNVSQSVGQNIAKNSEGKKSNTLASKPASHMFGMGGENEARRKDKKKTSSDSSTASASSKPRDNSERSSLSTSDRTNSAQQKRVRSNDDSTTDDAEKKARGHKGNIQLPVYVERTRDIWLEQGESESNTDDSEIEDEAPDFYQRRAHNTLFEIMMSNRALATSLIPANIILTDSELQCIQKCWSILIESDDAGADSLMLQAPEVGVNRLKLPQLCELVMLSLKGEKQCGSRLYSCSAGLEGMKELVLLIRFIYTSLIDFAKFERHVFELSIKHEICHVDAESLRHFNQQLALSVPKVVGDVVIGDTNVPMDKKEIEKAWYRFAKQVSSIMLSCQKYSQVYFLRYLVHRLSIPGKPKWVLKTGLVVTIDTLYLFETSHCIKTIAQIPICDILKVFDFFMGKSTPTKYGFEMSQVKDETVYQFCFIEEKDMQECRRFLESRIRNHDKARHIDVSSPRTNTNGV